MTAARKPTVRRGKCGTPYCRRPPGNCRFCSTCRSRQSRAADPVRYSYNCLKNRSKQRKILFTLTLEQFRKFCYKTNYIAGKGKTRESYSIDRKKNTKGYTIGNIRVMPLGDNSKKFHLEFQRDSRGVPEGKSFRWVKRKPRKPEPDDIF